MGIVDPKFSESQFLMGDQLDGPIVDFLSLFQVLCDLLLENGVVVPQVDVPPPKPFLLDGRDHQHSGFVGLPDLLHVPKRLLEEEQIEPCVVVEVVLGNEVLVHIPPLAEDDFVYLIFASVFLLEVEVIVVEFLGLFLGDVFQPKLENFPGPLEFSLSDFELGELDEVALVEGFRAQLSDDPLVDGTGGLLLPGLHLGFRHFEVGGQAWIRLQIFIQNLLGSFRLSHPLLKLDETHPCLLAGHPVHPPGEDLPGFDVVANEFLHVGILEPKLVFPGQVVSGPLPHVPGVVDELVLHLHLGVLQPQTLVGVVDFQGPLVDGSGSCEFLEVFLPLGVADPDGQVVPLATQLVLELPALLLGVYLQLFLVHDGLKGGLDGDLPVDLGVLQDLVGGELDVAGPLVLNGWRLHLDFRHFCCCG